MVGSFLRDNSAFRDLSLQEAAWHCCALRLAILYDAPLEVQLDIISKATKHIAGAAPLVYGTEWQFLSALALLRSDPKDPRIEQARSSLSAYSGSKWRRPLWIGFEGDHTADHRRRYRLCQ